MTVDRIAVSSSNPIDGLSVSGVEVGTTFPPRPDAGSTKAATTVVPGSATGTVTLEVRADWDPDPRNQTTSFRVTLPGGCTTPAEPSADIVASCRAGGAVVTLTNSGGTPVAFTVFRDGVEIATVDVAAGGSVTEQYALAEDETATFSVEAPGMDTVLVPVTRDCEAPAAAISFDCADGFTVVLSNGGELPVTFTVTRPTVPPRMSRSVRRVPSSGATSWVRTRRPRCRSPPRGWRPPRRP